MIEIVPNWHPIFVHFTVAMLTVSIALFFTGYAFNQSKRHEQILIVAHWNFWIGTLAAIVTAIAGWLAYNSVTHDTPSHAAMTVHRNWALITLAVLIPAAIWLAWSRRSMFKISNAFLAALFITMGLLGSTAWHGGELVYRYGLGVMSMPMMNEGGDGQGGHKDDHDQTTKSAPANVDKQPKPSNPDGHNHDH